MAKVRKIENWKWRIENEKRYKILLTVVVVLGIAYFCLPYYARQALFTGTRR